MSERTKNGRFAKGNSISRKTDLEKAKTSLSRAEKTKKRKEQISLVRDGIAKLTEKVLVQLTEKIENNELSSSDLAQLYPKLLNYLVPKLKQEELINADGNPERKPFTIAIVRTPEDVKKLNELNSNDD